MPKYRIVRNYGYVGTRSEEIVEASDEEEAEELARDFAMERVDYWSELVDDEDE